MDPSVRALLSDKVVRQKMTGLLRDIPPAEDIWVGNTDLGDDGPSTGLYKDSDPCQALAM
jgi:hypothetical protein